MITFRDPDNIQLGILLAGARVARLSGPRLVLVGLIVPTAGHGLATIASMSHAALRSAEPRSVPADPISRRRFRDRSSVG